MGLTSAQRYNKRLDEIWENARRLGAFKDKEDKKVKRVLKGKKKIKL